MRTRIRDLRRRELVEATMEVISELGFEKATIADISKRAGFSMGYLHHHFRNKDEILLETKRVYYADMRQYLVNTIIPVSDPRTRLRIIIDANFRSEQFTPENAYTWVSFIARVPFNAEYRRFQNIVTRRLHSNLLFNLKQLLAQEKAEAATDKLITLLHGYWVQLGIDRDSIDSESVIQRMNLGIDRLLQFE